MNGEVKNVVTNNTVANTVSPAVAPQNTVKPIATTTTVKLPNAVPGSTPAVKTPAPATPTGPATKIQAPSGTNPVNQSVKPITGQVVQPAKPVVQQPQVAVKPAVQNVSPQNGSAPAVSVNPSPNVITPEAITRELNTDRKKESSNIFIFIMVALLGLFIFFIDDIVNYFTEDNFQYVYGTSDTVKNKNLLNGFIKIGENDSYITISKIKFYNFKLATDGNISFNYSSEKAFSSVANEKIYVEIYDSNQDLLYKELFNPTSAVEVGSVREYAMDVDADVYYESFYAKVIIYSEDEKKSTQILTCYLNTNNELITLDFTIKFYFTNKQLQSYTVSKKYEAKGTSNTETKYKNDLKTEFLKLNDSNLKGSYTDTSLSYSITLSEIPESYKPYYKINTAPKVIENKQSNEKWKCQ